MRYSVSHSTVYTYADAVGACHNQLHLHPRNGGPQVCDAVTIEISPTPVQRSERWDYFGNRMVLFSIQEAHRELAICARSTVTVQPTPTPDPLQTQPWQMVVERLSSERTRAALDAYQFCFDSSHVPRSQAAADYAAPSFVPGRPLLDAAIDLMHRIYADFRYDPGVTTVATPVDEVLRLRGGVCQDFSHLMIAALRSLGLAARYVSGYLVTQTPDGQPRLVGADASHAWVSLWLPDSGWVELDPTNNLLPTDRHVIVAYGRDYADVTPVRGVILGGGRHTLTVAVEVTPCPES